MNEVTRFLLERKVDEIRLEMKRYDQKISELDDSLNGYRKGREQLQTEVDAILEDLGRTVTAAAA